MLEAQEFLQDLEKGVPFALKLFEYFLERPLQCLRPLSGICFGKLISEAAVPTLATGAMVWGPEVGVLVMGAKACTSHDVYISCSAHPTH